MSADTRPAIRFVNYMSGREEMDSTYLIGPYDSVEARDGALARFQALPLGAPEYNGGQEYLSATMADQGSDVWFDETVPPGQVAAATSQRGFHNLFAGCAEDDDG